MHAFGLALASLLSPEAPVSLPGEKQHQLKALTLEAIIVAF